MTTIHETAPNQYATVTGQRLPQAPEDATITTAKALLALADEKENVEPNAAAAIIVAHHDALGAKSIVYDDQAMLLRQIRSNPNVWALTTNYLGVARVPAFVVQAREFLITLPADLLDSQVHVFNRPGAEFPDHKTVREGLTSMATNFTEVCMATGGDTFLLGADEEDEAHLEIGGEWVAGQLLTEWLTNKTAAIL